MTSPPCLFLRFCAHKGAVANTQGQAVGRAQVPLDCSVDQDARTPASAVIAFQRRRPEVTVIIDFNEHDYHDRRAGASAMRYVFSWRVDEALRPSTRSRSKPRSNVRDHPLLCQPLGQKRLRSYDPVPFRTTSTDNHHGREVILF